MGNCQTAETACILIQSSNGDTVQRLHCSEKASTVMASNPGYYVTVIVTVKNSNTDSGKKSTGVQYLTLLSPDDSLVIGQVYRLVSFEDVLREFGSKRRVRLSRVLARQREAGKRSQNEDVNEVIMKNDRELDNELEAVVASMDRSNNTSMRRQQWKPALQTIKEVGV